MFRNFEQDPFNRYSNRTPKNTDHHLFNCAGYALGTISWYCPNTEADQNLCPHFWGGYDYGFNNDQEAWQKTTKAVAQMVEDFCGDLRVIFTTGELQTDEYAVAFRLSSDGDFHYVRRGDNNVWYHKRGAAPEILRMRKTTVFTKEWCNRYDGPIVLLAIKKERY